MQMISLLVVATSVASLNFNGMSCTFQATPLMPLPLLPTAPTTDATAVPWPSLSLISPSEPLPLVTIVLIPLRSLAKPSLAGCGLTQRLPAKSSCVGRRPESIIATITFGASCRRSQAASALIPPPVLKFHCVPNCGSLGVAVA